MKEFLIILTIFLFACHSQTIKETKQIVEQNISEDINESDSLIFIDTDSMLANIRQKGKSSVFYKNDLLNTILYLDKSSIGLLKIVVPGFIQEKGIDTSEIFRTIDPKVIQIYPVNIRNIKDYFTNEINWKETARMFKDEPLDSSAYLYNRIYIKNNYKALFTIADGYVSGTFRATLRNHTITLEPIKLGIH